MIGLFYNEKDTTMLIDIRELCKKYNFNPIGIIHGGAHEAEEMSVYEQVGAKNRIWIEGNTRLCENLKTRLKITHKQDIVIDALLWSESGIKFNFNITNNGQSSSILELWKHKDYYPQIEYIEFQEKESTTLDDLFVKNNLNIDSYDFLNLDLQGVELDVLKGFKNNLNKIKYVYTEINTGEVYKNCSKLHDIDDYLKESGFIRLETHMTSAEWGDAFYMKVSKLWKY